LRVNFHGKLRTFTEYFCCDAYNAVK